MPLYEYVCRDCDTQSEVLVQGSQQPECPKCGSGKLTKLLSVVAAPGRDAAAATQAPRMGGGSCGTGCGCHPH
jgi:putative FmdB family regulatory protein